MELNGFVKHGVIVLTGGATLPEGVQVRVLFEPSASSAVDVDANALPVRTAGDESIDANKPSKIRKCCGTMRGKPHFATCTTGIAAAASKRAYAAYLESLQAMNKVQKAERQAQAAKRKSESVKRSRIKNPRSGAKPPDPEDRPVQAPGEGVDEWREP